MNAQLYSHQQKAVDRLRSGSILVGGVGTGKSITALAWCCVRLFGSKLENGVVTRPGAHPMIYIITTARKRDTKEWDGECARFDFKVGSDYMVDSWNNLHKYVKIQNAVFIFDEQRVVGSGAWVKAFLTIAKFNKWILLSATPGDGWMDYIPVFIANGYYRNRTQFLRRHAVYSRFAKYPKVERWLETGYLEELRQSITVTMKFDKKTTAHRIDVPVVYNRLIYEKVACDRWDPFEDCPIQDAAQACYLMRRVVNSDESRFVAVARLLREHRRAIVFYNYDYELDILRKLRIEGPVLEWNGHRHQTLPEDGEFGNWVYLVQYTAGCEGWNCTTTDTVIFYSQSYSYKQMQQAAGRIDRLNTPYKDLYYYTLKSRSGIDMAIARALRNKKNFNERNFAEQLRLPLG